MLFNSIEFALFLPLVFILYWFATGKNIKAQNILLLVASYFFYGWWDWRFLSLLLISSLADYFLGLLLSKTSLEWKRKLWLSTSIAVNIGILGYFKYFNFFVDNFIEAFSFVGLHLHVSTLKIILPVGISFYTFQTLSYTIDIYRRKMEANKDFIAFMAYVSFFPQLVAGPIERAYNLLPQFKTPRKFEYMTAVDGMQQILWGLFKKVVVADNCAPIVEQIFSNSSHYSGSVLVVGVILFAFQIYGDFSGYSDIAIGTARLFGFSLMRNFAYPYFARDIAEFWRRWHISLTTWFRDYVYIPLGGSRGNKWSVIRNTFVVFLVSGFWHGANWTFIVWGFLNALYFLPLLLAKRNRQNIEIVAKGKLFPTFKEVLGMAVTFSLTLLAWVFFRADNVTDAFVYLGNIFNPTLFTFPEINTNRVWIFIIMLVVFEWIFREYQYGLQIQELRINSKLKWALFLAIGLIIFAYGSFNKTEFIYFAF